MPSFSYIARDDRGRIDRGIMVGASAEEIRTALKAKNLNVEEILEMRVPNPSPVNFTPAMPWTTVTDTKEERKTERAMEKEEKSYVPFVETLRLFAGWLLAWYGLVYLLGDFQLQNRIPEDLPYLGALFVSPIVLRFTFGTFLFLLLTAVHKLIGGGIGKGIGLTIVGVAVFVLFHLNAV